MKKKYYHILLITCLIFYAFANDAIENKEDEVTKPLVSIHAEDTHLPTILSMLASESGYNIVTGPTVQTQNKLTIHLDNVPIDQAVNLVIRAAGLSYEIVGNSILVANQSKINEDIGVSPHVIALQYSNAVDIADLLSNVSKEITVDATGNKLLVTASPKKIAEIEEIIKDIDVPSIQIMLEARLIEVALNDQEIFGIDWEKLSQISLIFAESGAPQKMSQSTNFEIVNDLITGSYMPGSVWEIIDPNEGVSGDEFLVELVSGTPTGEIPEDMMFTRGESAGMSRQLTAFDFTLDWMIKDNLANIITNSQVVTVNGHEAEIKMVDVIPYLASSGGQGNSNFQVLKEQVGIKLNILPYVNTDGYITTKITPEVSSIQSWTAQGYPWTKKRVSTTTVRVKDGEAIIIAGLVTSEQIKTENKVPLLWRIPLIGKWLFTHSETQDKKTDLIIEVRPKIIKDHYSGIDKQEYHKKAENKAFDIKEEE